MPCRTAVSPIASPAYGQKRRVPPQIGNHIVETGEAMGEMGVVMGKGNAPSHRPYDKRVGKTTG